ncbi:GntR family transcriptional regulator [Bacillus sp. JJ1532]|uniref:GntR family transcriptional regulator n=1 Tax=unclassified Bacillus (in: firmicutes) TaxID=185979 RepID=UPI002FFDB218
MDQNSLERALPFYEQIQQTIKKGIWEGIYKPGDRMYESQLAKQFAISRSPVREAIRALINEGLLIMDDKSQIIVYKPSLQDVQDIYDCRLALESKAVALAAVRASEAQINELESILLETEEAINRKEKEEIVACNSGFHELIIHISGNLRLKKLVNELHSLTHYYRLLNLEGANRAETILNGHRQIFEAIKERNSEKAAKRLIEHTKEDLENLVQLIKEKER